VPNSPISPIDRRDFPAFVLAPFPSDPLIDATRGAEVPLDFDIAKSSGLVERRFRNFPPRHCSLPVPCEHWPLFHGVTSKAERRVKIMLGGLQDGSLDEIDHAPQVEASTMNLYLLDPHQLACLINVVHV
jgi:hypothetical protein